MKIHSLVFACSLLVSFAANAETLYTNDFQSAEIGKVPEDLLVLDGQFAVREEGANRFLELPGAPTDTYTVMFGPATNTNIGASARIFATSKGRRMPAFAVALHGVGGYKLQVSAAKKLVELYKGDQVVQSTEYQWKSGEWTLLKLNAAKSGSETRIEGTVVQGNAEPAKISFVDKEEITPGKAAITGTPFAGTPIHFDDISVFTLKP